jgi:glycosyltransferase involved in cell wall biosynthesis
MASVDVAVPCYQYGRYLRTCVESVLSQDVEKLRVLIIDNASSDDSAAVARQLAAEDDRVELVLRERNLGLHASFNEGIDWAQADYFTILAADDCLAPGALARAVAALEERPEASFAIGREQQFWGEAPQAVPTSSQTPTRRTCIPSISFIEERFLFPGSYQAGFLVVRTKAQKCAGYYRPELPHTDDLEMLLRLAMQGPIVALDAIQGLRREHAINRSNDYRSGDGADGWHRLSAFESFFRNEGAALRERVRLHELSRRGLAEWAYWSAVSHAVRGHVTGAVSLFHLAIGLRPRMALLPPFNYLGRLERPGDRIASVLSSAAERVAFHLRPLADLLGRSR